MNEKQLLKTYDEIYGAMFVNLYTLSKNSKNIVLSPFDPNNKEYLLVLQVARGVGDVYGKKVCIDVSKFQLWKLNRKLSKECRILQAKNCGDDYKINANTLLDYMREKAQKSCGEDFTFADIYNAFYTRKEK